MPPAAGPGPWPVLTRPEGGFAPAEVARLRTLPFVTAGHPRPPHPPRRHRRRRRPRPLAGDPRRLAMSRTSATRHPPPPPAPHLRSPNILGGELAAGQEAGSPLLPPPPRGPPMKLTVAAETFPLAEVFTISRGSRTEARVLTVTIEDGGQPAAANACPTPATARRLDSVAAQIEGLPRAVRPRRAAAPAAGRRRPQRGRLRALGPRGEAHRRAGSGSSPACRAGPGDHRLHAVARHPGGDARRRRRGTPTARS